MCSTSLCSSIEIFFILGWGNMLATHESQSLSRKDSIPALHCYFFTPFPSSWVVLWDCFKFHSITTPPAHIFKQARNEPPTGNPLKTSSWALAERTVWYSRQKLSAELWCNGIVRAFYWVLKLIWVMQVWNQMCHNFEKALNTPNCFIISF